MGEGRFTRRVNVVFRRKPDNVISCSVRLMLRRPSTSQARWLGFSLKPAMQLVSHSDVDKYRFINRTANIWNTLPPSVVQFTSLAAFKRTITNVNLSIFTVL